jgi:uncharacterized protein (TIGR03083 family)
MGTDAPGIVAESSARALESQLDEVWSSLATLGAGLSDAEWDAPTACPGWPVSAQYAHVIGTESVLLGRPSPELPPVQLDHVRNDIGGFNEAWILSMAAEPRQSVLDRFVEVTSARRKALAAMGEDEFAADSWTPIGPADYRRFMQIRVFDCWVHEQDIRYSIGRPGHDDGPVADQSVDEVVRAIGYIIGKKAGAGPEASVSITLTGPVGRQIEVAMVAGRARVVAHIDGSPAATLSLSSTAFTRLACGRIDAPALRAGAFGGVLLGGDTAFGERIVDSLPFTI